MPGVQQFARVWAANAMSLGWAFDELFAFAEPFANVSLQGAAWFVGGSTVTAVTADTITLRTERGATRGGSDAREKAATMSGPGNGNEGQRLLCGSSYATASGETAGWPAMHDDRVA